MKKLTGLAIILSVLCSFGNAKAQEEAPVIPPNIPEELQKTWVLPDCRDADEVAHFTEDSLILISPRIKSKMAVKELEEIKGYWLARFEGDSMVMALSEDAILTTARITPEIFDGAKPDWDTLPLQDRQEYVTCLELPDNKTTQILKQELQK